MMPQTWNNMTRISKTAQTSKRVNRRPYRLLPWFLRGTREVSEVRMRQTMFSQSGTGAVACFGPLEHIPDQHRGESSGKAGARHFKSKT